MTVARRILFVNASIVVVGALLGTYVTATLARSTPTSSMLWLPIGFALLGLILSVVANQVALNAMLSPLESMDAAARAIRLGNTSARAKAAGMADAQMTSLVHTFNATLDQLDEDRSRLRSLASQIIRAQEDERRRIARELHDDTAQVLFAQLLRVAPLKQSTDPAVRAVAEQLEAMTVEAIDGVRRLALELRPPALDDLGLEAAVTGLAQRYTDDDGLQVDVSFRGVRSRLPPATELVIYRVVQESLSNAARHAEARHVGVNIDHADDFTTVSIIDDGRGFSRTVNGDGDRQGLGLGLFGMQERVALAGGQLSIWTTSGHGTEVFASIPRVELSTESKGQELGGQHDRIVEAST